MQETNINKYLHHKESLVPYSESDRTCYLYHVEPLRCNVAAYFELHYIDYQLANISSIGTGIAKARGVARSTGNHRLYIYIYIYLYILFHYIYIYIYIIREVYV